MLDWLVNPNIALLFLVGGALLIYLEFNTPGTIVPGALGTLMVLLGIFGLDCCPSGSRLCFCCWAEWPFLSLKPSSAATGCWPAPAYSA